MALKQLHLPEHIYKYRRDCGTSRENLKTDTVWFSSPDSYNDPYDCEFKITDTRVVRAVELRLVDLFITTYHLEGAMSAAEIAEAKGSDQPLATVAEYVSELKTAPGSNPKLMAQYCSTVAPGLVRDALSAVRQWRALTKVCSFSTINDSLLMWSHYADNHRGFCIEYGLKNLVSSHPFRRFLYPVIYSELLYDLTAWAETLVNPNRTEFNTDCLILGVLHKFQGWEYEDEWRLVEVTQSLIPDHSFPAPTPTRIFLGSRMEKERQNELVAICKEKQIEVHQMELSKDIFQLLPHQIQ